MLYAIIHSRFSKTKKLKQKPKQQMRSKQKARRFNGSKKSAYRLMAVMAILALSASSATVAVRAASCSTISECNSKISSLQDKNGTYANKVNKLELQASSYQDAINKLQQQINSVQQAINSNQQKQVELQHKIAEYQRQIDQQRELLGNDIKAMYVDGQMSNIEILASSKNLSDYVDKQEYRGVVQDKIQTTLDQIAELQNQLQTQKAKVESLIATQKNQEAQLAADRAQQKELLSFNQQQRDKYNSQISSNNAKISKLRSRQAQLNLELSSGGGRVVAGNPGHGGYPAYLDNAAQDSLIDPWGMYNRECVSYTAWKVQNTFGYMPNWGGVGNANEWPGDAVSAGIPTGYTPRVHSVAIWNVGTYGHAMWVEAVNSDGSIWVSQYNYDYTGHYSEMLVSPSMASSLTYIYFR